MCKDRVQRALVPDGAPLAGTTCSLPLLWGCGPTGRDLDPQCLSLLLHAAWSSCKSEVWLWLGVLAGTRAPTPEMLGDSKAMGRDQTSLLSRGP